jgi:small basic protein
MEFRSLRAASPAFLVTALLGGIVVEWLAILLINHGQFTFTLDDPYIHLALAENIARGHYGINVGEVSSPSSSIIWPFLLAPVAALSGVVHLVVLLNTAAAAGTVLVVHRVLRTAFASWPGPGQEWFTNVLGLLLVVGTNLIALVFTGMEHSVQVLLSALAVLGLTIEARQNELRRWLLPVLVAGPLVRYENLAISLPALAYLALRGRLRAAVTASITLVLLLGGFSWYLVTLGLPPLPASISAKSDLVAGDSIVTMISSLYRALTTSPRGVLLAVGAILLAAAAGSPRRVIADRLLACALAAGVGLHLLVGQYGWFSRYEIYLWIAVLLGLLVMFGPSLARVASQFQQSVVVSLGLLSIALLSPPYLYALLITPVAANNIYEQNLQMRRFITEYVREPVAVNDIGFVSWRNPDDIIDLLGLASLEAQKRRRTSQSSSWVMPLMSR